MDLRDHEIVSSTDIFLSEPDGKCDESMEMLLHILEHRIFNNDLISKYFVTEVDKKAVFLCCESVSVLKDYKIICYYVTKHADYVNILSAEPRQTRAKYLD
ncbi:hypothetical protein RF11_11326 [Thelohanellus kitauei]|uniref:Uncharacterized protein n=1 Tax=Thelohanellus kitauei TaxID=669202 RepID=A0A0C2MHQ6_THEKT|nr:hypothetical protein RF11_11326 [Thelohanellus kitauei]